jgi:hypothetical protein
MIFADFEAKKFPKIIKALRIILDFWDFSKNA